MKRVKKWMPYLVYDSDDYLNNIGFSSLSCIMRRNFLIQDMAEPLKNY